MLFFAIHRTVSFIHWHHMYWEKEKEEILHAGAASRGVKDSDGRVVMEKDEKKKEKNERTGIFLHRFS